MSRHNCAIGKDYVPASFKGAAFYCVSADVEGGRRGAEGEFPFGEQTAYADLGRKIRVYKLTAAFRDDNHVGDSQALFEACQSPGPGILVHPTRGAFMAACRSVKVTDSIEEEAGETKAELEFVEANEVVNSGVGSLLFGILPTALATASQDTFLTDYQPLQVSRPWSADIISTTQQLTAALALSAAQVLPVTAPAHEQRALLNIQEVSTDPIISGNAKTVDLAFTNGFNIVTNYTTDNYDKQFKMMRDLANKGVPASTLPLPDGTAIDSQEAVLARFRTLAAIGMAQSALSRTYHYVDEALSALDITMKVLEDEAKAVYVICNNELFLGLRSYEIAFSKMMYDITYRLPPILAVDFVGGVFPLVAAYAIYADAKRHRELELRNIVDANGRFGSPVIGVAPTTAVQPYFISQRPS